MCNNKNKHKRGAELGQVHATLEVRVEFEFDMGVEIVVKAGSYKIDTKLNLSWSFGSSWSFTTFWSGGWGWGRGVLD